MFSFIVLPHCTDKCDGALSLIIPMPFPPFQQRLKERFHVLSDVLASLVLPFDHPSGDKRGARAG